MQDMPHLLPVQRCRVYVGQAGEGRLGFFRKRRKYLDLRQSQTEQRPVDASAVRGIHSRNDDTEQNKQGAAQEDQIIPVIRRLTHGRAS